MTDRKMTGEFSGKVEETSHQILNGKEAADALIAQDSDSTFFRIDEEGNDVE